MNTAQKYLTDNFQPTDRLAVVLLDKRNDIVIQRIATADQIASDRFQAWLRHKNTQRYEVYVSMNTLHEGATGRTKADIATIRHLYLDFDENGTEAVARMLARPDIPKPNYRLSSSPGKWQVVWKVEGFSQDNVEGIQRTLARELGADPAATDSARVLRIPGFYNHKYETPHFVTVEGLSDRTCVPEDFPELERDEPHRGQTPLQSHRPEGRGLSRSEEDWAFAKRALALGQSPEAVTATIAAARTDKHNPKYYAEHTVVKAAAELKAESMERGLDR